MIEKERERESCKEIVKMREKQVECISKFEKCRGKADKESERIESERVVSFQKVW